ncbi:hypothetical protein V6N13_033764 [Hibiscus sabdariffa]
MEHFRQKDADASPAHSPAAAPEEAGPSAPAAAHYPPTSTPQVFLEPSHTSTTSPTITPAAMPAIRQSTPDSPLGSASTPPSSPPLAQSEEAVPLHILQLRNQLQRIEAMQLQFQEETKATQQENLSAATRPQQSTNPSAKAGETEEVHLSSDDDNDIFDWQSPREHHILFGPTSQQAHVPKSSSARQPQKPAPTDVPILHLAPTMPDTSTRRKGKAPTGRNVSRIASSSPYKDEQLPRPAKRQRRYHIITADSDDDSSAAVLVDDPEKSANPSPSFTI